jgi:hypothetical protein
MLCGGDRFQHRHQVGGDGGRNADRVLLPVGIDEGQLEASPVLRDRRFGDRGCKECLHRRPPSHALAP